MWFDPWSEESGKLRFKYNGSSDQFVRGKAYYVCWDGRRLRLREQYADWFRNEIVGILDAPAISASDDKCHISAYSPDAPKPLFAVVDPRGSRNEVILSSEAQFDMGRAILLQSTAVPKLTLEFRVLG